MESLLNYLLWVEELLPHDIQMLPGKHGGQSYYLDGHLVLILVERSGKHYEYKGITYPFDLWRGCIFPVEYKKQNAFFKKYVFLENHPASKDWLYIPMDSENFEDEVKQMLRELSKRNVLLGVPVKIKNPSQVKSKSVSAKTKPKKAKTDKKKENAFLLGLAERKNK